MLNELGSRQRGGVDLATLYFFTFFLFVFVHVRFPGLGSQGSRRGEGAVGLYQMTYFLLSMVADWENPAENLKPRLQL